MAMERSMNLYCKTNTAVKTASALTVQIYLRVCVSVCAGGGGAEAGCHSVATAAGTSRNKCEESDTRQTRGGISREEREEARGEVGGA